MQPQTADSPLQECNFVSTVTTTASSESLKTNMNEINASEEMIDDEQHILSDFINMNVNVEYVDEMMKEMLKSQGLNGFEDLNRYPMDQILLKRVETLIMDGNCLDSLKVCRELIPSIDENKELIVKFNIVHLAFEYMENKLREMILGCTIDDYCQQLKCIEFCNSTIPPDKTLETSPDHALLMDTLMLLLRQKDCEFQKMEQLEKARLELWRDFKRFWSVSKIYKDSDLEIALKYLIINHNIYHIMNGIESKFPEIEKLLLPEKEDAIYNPKQTNQQRFVLDLCQKLCLTRDESMSALYHAQSDINLAIRNESSRFQLDKKQFIILLEEYVVERGLVNMSEEKKQMYTLVKQLIYESRFDELVKYINNQDSNILKEYSMIDYRIHECLFFDSFMKGNDSNALSIVLQKMMPYRMENSKIEEDFNCVVSLLAFDKDSSMFTTNDHVQTVIRKLESNKSLLEKSIIDVLSETRANNTRFIQILKYLMKNHEIKYQFDTAESELLEYLKLKKVYTQSFSHLRGESVEKEESISNISKQDQDIQLLYDILQLTKERSIELLKQFKTVDAVVQSFFIEEE